MDPRVIDEVHLQMCCCYWLQFTEQLLAEQGHKFEHGAAVAAANWVYGRQGAGGKGLGVGEQLGVRSED